MATRRASQLSGSLITASGNRVYNNTSTGITANSGALVVNNTVYDHSGINAVGIQLFNQATVRQNVVYGNYQGIVGGYFHLNSFSGEITDNRVYGNSQAGISLSSVNATLSGNQVYSNSVGINVSGLARTFSTTSCTPTPTRESC